MTYYQSPHLGFANTIKYEYDDSNSNSSFSNEFFKHDFSAAGDNLDNCFLPNLDFSYQQQQQQNNNEGDLFWGQSRIEDVLVNFSPSDIKLEFTDDILPMPSQQCDANLSNDVVFSHDSMQHNHDLMNNINLEILSLSNNNINEDNLYYQQNYEKNNNIFIAHQVVSQFDQQNNVLVDNNQINKHYSNNQPSTSFINMNCQHQNDSNQQHMHLEMYQNNENSEFMNLKQENISDFNLNSSPTNTMEIELYEMENHEHLEQRHGVVYHQHHQQNYDYQNPNYQQNVIVNCVNNEENDFFDEDDEYLNEDDKENINNVNLSINHQGKSNKKEGGGKRSEEPQMAGGYIKPPYSYSCLITLALKNSPNGELTVAEIYAFLCEHFPYFCAAPIGWKNSVRHNLSLNKSFQKIEVETPGCHGRKSCLWKLNSIKIPKMNQELNKWHERSLAIILESMRNPELFDAVENGTMGMPESVIRCQSLVSISNSSLANINNDSSVSTINSNNQKLVQQSKIIRNSNCDFDVSNQTPLSTINNRSVSTQSSSFNVHNNTSKNNGESIHKVAVRKLDYLLQQKSATILNPNKDLLITDQFLTPPPSKRALLSATNNNMSMSSENLSLENRVNGITKRRSSNKSINKINNYSVIVNKRLFHSNSPPHVMRNRNGFFSNMGQSNNKHNQYRSHFQLSSSSTNFKIMEKQNNSFQQQTLTNDFQNVYISDGFKNSTVMKDVTNTSIKMQNIFEPQEQLDFDCDKMSNKSFNNQIYDERSMSPILYSSTYDTVTDAINNNSLLFSNSESP